MALVLKAGEMSERIIGFGHPDLSLEDTEDMVFRKSDYICPRTVLIGVDKAARDLDRSFVRILQDPGTVIQAELITI